MAVAPLIQTPTRHDRLSQGRDEHFHHLQPHQLTDFVFNNTHNQPGIQTWSQLQSLSIPRSSHTPSFSFSSPTEVSIDQVPELMNEHNHWQGQQRSPYTPRSVGALPTHQRNSSLSTLASAGPSSPYTQTTSNPQIAIDSASDGYADTGFQDTDDFAYHGKQGMTQDTFNYPSTLSHARQQSAGISGQRSGSNMLHPHSDFQFSSSANPMSVASSNSGDSPITPTIDDHQHKRLQRQTQPPLHHIVPKFDRTMTDVYQDELFNPNFPITTTLSPSTPSTAVSPSSDIFSQRLHAANSQHLSAQSPATTISRERSPFRQGSPLAPVSHDFVNIDRNNSRAHRSTQHHQSMPATSQQDTRFALQQYQGQVKPERDAAAAMLRRQQMMPRPHQDPETTKTISPKDAMLDFPEPGDAANFPLFPDSNGQFMGLGDGSGAHNGQNFSTIPVTSAHDGSFHSFMPTSLTDQLSFMSRSHDSSDVAQISTHIQQLHQQAHQPQQHQLHSPTSPHKPISSNTDKGAFTCTYQGCPQRFETPALLQKHKREGHRQVHGLGASRRDVTMLAGTSSTQNGPHKCTQINPSTGKPCNTEFSRPYDLTRHEDTIHNPKKRKVSCPICTDKKQFSRGDALSRHYRVCHPELAPPGRRRGGTSRG